jgi:hypothetical protein
VILQRERLGLVTFRRHQERLDACRRGLREWVTIEDVVIRASEEVFDERQLPLVFHSPIWIPDAVVRGTGS